MKYKGIILDFNGVLLWDTEWHIESWLAVTNELGKPLTLEQIENNHGRLGSEIFRELIGDEVSDSVIEHWILRKEEIYREIAVSKGKLFSLSAGSVELFELLKVSNIPITIATASEKTNLKFFVENLHLEKWFDISKIIYDDGNLPGKPSPVMYLRAAEKLNLSPEECLVVEDSKMGLASARNAKAGKIIAIGPKEKHESLRKIAGVAKVITQLNEITLSDFD